MKINFQKFSGRLKNHLYVFKGQLIDSGYYNDQGLLTDEKCLIAFLV